MKILFVQTPAFAVHASGVPRVTYNLGKYFSRNGLEVAYFTFENKENEKAEYGELFHASAEGSCENSINIKDLENCIKQFKPNRVINQMPYEFKISEALSDLKNNYNFKLIACIHNTLFSFKDNVSDIVRRSLPRPINHVMASKTMTKIPLAYHKIRHRKSLISILNLHDLLLLYTPANLEELKYFVNPKQLEKFNIDFMPNPVLSLRTSVPKKEKTILHLGRLNIQQKRSDLLVDFWEKVYKELPDWNFKIVGNGPYYDTLKSEITKRKLTRIHLLGYQKPETYYEEAAMFMMPSAYEGLPHTIIESQSFGCPVLAFDSFASLKYIVDDHKNAFIIPPFNINKMAEHCIKMAKNHKLLEEMQESALLSAQRFHIDKVGNQWFEMLNKIDNLQ